MSYQRRKRTTEDRQIEQRTEIEQLRKDNDLLEHLLTVGLSNFASFHKIIEKQWKPALRAVAISFQTNYEIRKNKLLQLSRSQMRTERQRLDKQDFTKGKTENAFTVNGDPQEANEFKIIHTIIISQSYKMKKLGYYILNKSYQKE
ncbi:MAG: hypothetical protein EZS28_014443 [Streblomastix strix]|uniref:Uncharacterized protein n=1 Tax=Streblomastix strix TaxID=222440 RepID=A0A5J4W5T6_9EUKA|nr:MAG: hypothetical protein EZS28_014443 [Streblomastix strix]